MTITWGSKINEDWVRIGEVVSVDGPFTGSRQVCYGAFVNILVAVKS